MIPLQLPWMTALGWALLHSLWQGLALALMAALALHLLRGRDASLRSAVAYAALLLMAAALCTTFLVLLPERSASTGSGAPSISHPLEAWVPYASLVWISGVGVLGARLGLGWTWLQRLRRQGSVPAEAVWQARLQCLAEAMGIPRGVKLLRSTLVQSPMVLGWLKPVVLVPAAAFTGLPPLALEAILAHELAHIRRLDYLFNLLQNLLETLLFYHPAAWWLGRQIRAERENAADDLAVTLIGDPVGYARALADLEALRSLSSTPLHLAPAATGGSLMHRIRRILLPPTPPLPSARAGLFTALALTTLGTATAVGFAEEAKPTETRRLSLQEGGRRIELQLKGEAKLDPKSESGVLLGQEGSAELTVREAPVRKKVTLRKDAKGLTKVLTEDGQEKPLKGSDEAWVKKVMEEMTALEAKVAPGKAGARSYRVELEEAGKGSGQPRIFTYRLGPGSGFRPDGLGARMFVGPGGELDDLQPELKERLKALQERSGAIVKRFHLDTEDLDGHLDRPRRKEIRIETRPEGKGRMILREGDRVIERDLPGPGLIWMDENQVVLGGGDPKAEAEVLRKQIERLQKRLKEVEAKAEAKPHTK